jgi:ParB-like chromosome segregation protein Spo0J
VLAVPDQEGRRRLARQIVRQGLSVRAAERAARWAGAKQKPRAKAAPVDPALAARACKALQRLTGYESRVRGSHLEVEFADEHGLEELVESLERLT